MVDEKQHSASRSARNSAIIMVCTLVSRILGIVKARAIASVFGAGPIADAINFTFNIPNNFRKLFAEGALNSAYIPVFAASIGRGQEGLVQSKELLKRMQAFQLLVSLPLIFLTWLFRTEIVRLFSDFTEGAQIGLSASLLVYFTVFLFTISFSALYSGVLQCHGSFFTAAFAPILFSLSVILCVLYTSSFLGAYSMALGVVLGGLLQAGTTFLGLRSFGYQLALSFDFSSKPFKQVMQGWWPVTLSAIVGIIGQQVAYYFASTLPSGSITAFSNAIIFWQTPYGIFFTGIATVYFPAMVVAFDHGDSKQLGEIIAQGVQFLATFLVPSAILLLALRNEVIATVLQNGEFSLVDTLRTSEVLRWYVWGMLALAWYAFLQKYCFSVKKFKLAFGVSCGVTFVDIFSTWLLLENGFGIGAISLANTISYIFGTIVLFFSTVLPLKGFPYVKLVKSLMRILIANVPFILAVWVYRHKASLWWQNGSTLPNALHLGVVIIVSMVIVLASYLLLKVEFLTALRHRKPL